jgi:RarD protein
MKAKIYLVLAMLTFGSIGLFVREIPLPSAQIAMTRGVIGSLFLLITSLFMKKKLSIASIKKNLFLLSASGAAIGFNWILLFEAYKYTTISNATLSYYFAPVFVVFLSPLVLKERLTKVKIVCILGAMAGMFLIAGSGNLGSFEAKELIGIGFGLSAAVLYASVVLMNKFMKDLTGLETTLVQLSTAALVLIPYVLLQGNLQFKELVGKEWFLLIFVGLIHTGIAYLVYFTVFQKLSSQTVAIFSYIDPISAIVMSAIFLGETMNGLQVLGGVLILGAAFLSGRASRNS